MKTIIIFSILAACYACETIASEKFDQSNKAWLKRLQEGRGAQKKVSEIETNNKLGVNLVELRKQSEDKEFLRKAVMDAYQSRLNNLDGNIIATLSNEDRKLNTGNWSTLYQQGTVTKEGDGFKDTFDGDTVILKRILPDWKQIVSWRGVGKRAKLDSVSNISYVDGKLTATLNYLYSSAALYAKTGAGKSDQKIEIAYSTTGDPVDLAKAFEEDKDKLIQIIGD
ncbi:MAG: hypothetical protein ACPGXY_03515 [Alphaproteobacteria bacterium]